MKFLGGIGLRIMNIRLDFETDPDRERDPGSVY